MKSEVVFGMLLWLGPLAAGPHSFKGLSMDSPIWRLQPRSPYFQPELKEGMAGKIMPPFTERLEPIPFCEPIEASFTRSEFTSLSDFQYTRLGEVYNSPTYSHVPKLEISLQPELEKLDEFLKKVKDVEYTDIKPELDQIVARVNEAIQEAVRETTYSSDEIEAAYAKIVQVDDAFGLGESDGSAQDISFDSKTLETDDRNVMYKTLLLLRDALARDEDLMLPLVHTRIELGTIYRHPFPAYERVRTEAYYVLKLVRKKMGWDGMSRTWIKLLCKLRS